MTPDQLDKALRSAIQADQRSVTAIAKAAGIPQPSLHRYLHDGQGLTWESVRKLMAECGLRIERKK